jgi:hypothetical protein
MILLAMDVSFPFGAHATAAGEGSARQRVVISRLGGRGHSYQASIRPAATSAAATGLGRGRLQLRIEDAPFDRESVGILRPLLVRSGNPAAAVKSKPRLPDMR